MGPEVRWYRESALSSLWRKSFLFSVAGAAEEALREEVMRVDDGVVTFHNLRDTRPPSWMPENTGAARASSAFA